MSPLLAYTSDNNEHSLRDAAENLAVHFKLTPEERQELLPSGHTAVFDNRVGWAKMRLLMSGPEESLRQVKNCELVIDEGMNKYALKFFLLYTTQRIEYNYICGN